MHRRWRAASRQNAAGGGFCLAALSSRRCIASRHVVADQFDHRVDIDAAGHVADEIYQRRDADKGQQDADAQREVRGERPSSCVLTLRRTISA